MNDYAGDDRPPEDVTDADWQAMCVRAQNAEQQVAAVLNALNANTYEQALQVMRDLNEISPTKPSDEYNREYCRGQIELLADMFGKRGVYIADRKLEIAADLGIPPEVIS